MKNNRPIYFGICSEKGGVGKTTTTVNIARALKKDGYEVLVVDLDQQGNMSRSFGYIKDGKPTSAELIYNEISGAETNCEDLIRKEASGIDYIPSSQMLVSITSLMANDSDSNYIIRRAFEKEAFQKYDFILFDCRTLLDLLVANALNASDYAIIPVEGAVYSYDGLSKMLDKVTSINHSTNPKLRVLGILLNKQNRTTVGISVADSIREEYGTLVFRTIIPNCPAQAENAIIGAGKTGTMQESFEDIVREIIQERLPLLENRPQDNAPKDFDIRW